MRRGLNSNSAMIKGMSTLPLAPLSDEPEVAEDDNDVEQEVQAPSVPPEPISCDASEPILPKEKLLSKVSSQKPHPLSILFGPPIHSEQSDDDGFNDATRLGGPM